MEIFKTENLSFAYPNQENEALRNINITIASGEFVTICGKSGCGKTTLLRLLKPILSPEGCVEGNIYFKNKSLSEYSTREQASEIGFVMQSPDNQIVTDKVWHEMAFGLESLGFSTPEIRARVSEMAAFFGIQTWFHKKVTELSGGQKQLLNLASVMVMQPSVLILDEPTSQLDPIAAQEFFRVLEKINRELGITVILTEHRLEEAFPVSDRVIVMDEGEIIADASPEKVAVLLKNTGHDMYMALPTPIRIYGAVDNAPQYPLTVREGRIWLEKYAEKNTLKPELIQYPDETTRSAEIVVEINDAYFRYEKDLPDVIKGLNIKVAKGELFSIVGGNGTGKTTALSLISGMNTPYRGEVRIKGKNIASIHNLCGGVLGVLPQNPQSIFAKKSVYLELAEMVAEEEKIQDIAQLCNITHLLESHPYDLSGGEQQRVALAKILLLSPEILLLDEPTKGMDAYFKAEFADILADLKANGVTIIMVSHDIEFCAEFSDICAMFFDGNITSVGTPGEFFSGKYFYTTPASRIARSVLPGVVLADDIILACGGKIQKREKHIRKVYVPKSKAEPEKVDVRKDLQLKTVIGIIFTVLFVVTSTLYKTNADIFNLIQLDILGLKLPQLIGIIEIGIALFGFIPEKELGININRTQKLKQKLANRTRVAALMILLAIPFTISAGVFLADDRRYYLISMLIILEAIVPFCMIFESRKPKARELVIISVLCAMAVAGRAAFFMLPQFTPTVAIIIITGLCFGGEAGFAVGAVTGFVSNFFFGQGPWTPWQMFALGIIGFLAGVIFRKGLLKKTRMSLCIFGFVATFAVYGGIMNPASVVMFQDKITWEMIASAYVLGLPFDLIHSISSLFFLWFIAEPMIDKLERVKVKYGLIE